MPPRRRHDRRRRVELTPSRALALTIGPHPLGDEADDVLAAVYAEYRDRILRDGPTTRHPWAFWAFDPDVPDDLRATRPSLRPVGAPDRCDPMLDLRRDAWLGTAGHARRHPENPMEENHA